jgi:hypothetical protein
MSLFSARSSLSSCSLAPSQGRFATFRHWISCTFRHSFNKNAILILLAIHGHRQAIRAVALAGLVVRAQTTVCDTNSALRLRENKIRTVKQRKR